MAPAPAQEPIHPTLFADANDAPGSTQDSSPYFVSEGVGEVGFGATTDGAGFASIAVTVPEAAVLVALPIDFQYLAAKPGGPLNGPFELSGGLELISGP